MTTIKEHINKTHDLIKEIKKNNNIKDTFPEKNMPLQNKDIRHILQQLKTKTITT